MIKISTSLLSSTDRIESIKKLDKTSTDYIHIDVMDNKFVPNYQMPLDEVNKLSKYSKKNFDIHLMMKDPETFINNINIPNLDSITIHIEIKKDIKKIIQLIKKKNCLVGIAIKPKTDINCLDNYLDEVDKVLVMSVEPGFGKQKFIEETTNRIVEIKKKNNKVPIEVDGGINNESINKIKEIADIAVSGSYITSSINYEEAINNLKN